MKVHKIETQAAKKTQNPLALQTRVCQTSFDPNLSSFPAPSGLTELLWVYRLTWLIVAVLGYCSGLSPGKAPPLRSASRSALDNAAVVLRNLEQEVLGQDRERQRQSQEAPEKGWSEVPVALTGDRVRLTLCGDSAGLLQWLLEGSWRENDGGWLLSLLLCVSSAMS